MPLITLQCLNGHTTEQYLHCWENLGCETRLCACGMTLAPAFSPGTTLTYFEEGAKGRWIHNLGDQPVFVTSHAQHQRLMKDAGVTQGQPNFMRGRKGYSAI